VIVPRETLGADDAACHVNIWSFGGAGFSKRAFRYIRPLFAGNAALQFFDIIVVGGGHAGTEAPWRRPGVVAATADPTTSKPSADVLNP